LQRFVEKISGELQEHSNELVDNSSVKGYLKSPLNDVLWVVSSRNDTGNNGTNGKVSENGTFQYWGGDLELGFEVKISGFNLGFWSLGVGVWGSRAGA